MSFDSTHWAERWIEVVKQNPKISTDKNTIKVWFQRAHELGIKEGKKQQKQDELDWINSALV